MHFIAHIGLWSGYCTDMTLQGGLNDIFKGAHIEQEMWDGPLSPSSLYASRAQIPRFSIIPPPSPPSPIKPGRRKSGGEGIGVGPLRSINVATVIVVDGLDEYRDKESQSVFRLSVLETIVSKAPKVALHHQQAGASHQTTLLLHATETFALQNTTSELAYDDIRAFLAHGLYYPVHPFHKLLSDCLTNPSRCTDERFLIIQNSADVSM